MTRAVSSSDVALRSGTRGTPTVPGGGVSVKLPWPTGRTPGDARIGSMTVRETFSGASDPCLVVRSHVQSFAQAAAQDADAGSALHDLQPAAGWVQETPVDQERRAHPRPVLFPVPTDLLGAVLNPVHRVLGELLDTAVVGGASGHPVKVRSRDLLEPPGDLTQVDVAVVGHEVVVVAEVVEELFQDVVRPQKRGHGRVDTKAVVTVAEIAGSAALHQGGEVFQLHAIRCTADSQCRSPCSNSTGAESRGVQAPEPPDRCLREPTLEQIVRRPAMGGSPRFLPQGRRLLEGVAVAHRGLTTAVARSWVPPTGRRCRGVQDSILPCWHRCGKGQPGTAQGRVQARGPRSSRPGRGGQRSSVPRASVSRAGRIPPCWNTPCPPSNAPPGRRPLSTDWVSRNRFARGRRHTDRPKVSGRAGCWTARLRAASPARCIWRSG